LSSRISCKNNIQVQ